MSVQDRKVAILTGAGTGIGLATARTLVANDVRIVAVGRTRESLQQVEDELGSDSVALHVADDVLLRAVAANRLVHLERFARSTDDVGRGQRFDVADLMEQVRT